MSKILDLNLTVFELVKENPEVASIMADLGFSEITKKVMLQSVGKIMTIPKGASMKKIPLEKIIHTFEENGFEVIHAPETGNTGAAADGGKTAAEEKGKDTAANRKGVEMAADPAGKTADIMQKETSGDTRKNDADLDDVQDDDPAKRAELLKSYLRRLGEGEDLEKVRAEFVRNFKDVDALEIMNAEQALLSEGAPLSEVQKLCDVHSALFHGSTREEKIANAEKAVEQSYLAKQGGQKSSAEGRNANLSDNARKAAEWLAGAGQAGGIFKNPLSSHGDADSSSTAEDTSAAGNTSGTGAQQANKGNAGMPADKNAMAAVLADIPGHPVNTFERENKALEDLIERAEEKMDDGQDIAQEIKEIRTVAVHYAKKGDLLYPHLKVKYGVTGPSEVMWTVDDEIRDELGKLVKEENHDGNWLSRARKVLQRAKEMIYKENNILFPICALKFSEDEWKQIYRDSRDYAPCLGITPEVWEDAEKKDSAENSREGEIVMPGGHFTLKQLTALLNTIPMEISFVDADNINRFFNEGPKVFKRPAMALDREVFTCHPPKVEAMVRQIIDDFRSGRRDSVPVWMEKNGQTMLVTYMAVRTSEGKYVGTAEFVQNMEEIKKHFENS